MINVDARLKKLRQQYMELERVRERGDLTNDQAREQALLDARIDELLGFHGIEPGHGRRDFTRKVIVEIEESSEDDSYAWSATVRLPNGEVLACSLSDDMPSSPGDAVQSAGRMLDRELAGDRWTQLFAEAERDK
jgi:hypothetical protein